MRKHGIVDAQERLIGGSLTPDFVSRFAIVGSPEHCTESRERTFNRSRIGQ